MLIHFLGLSDHLSQNQEMLRHGPGESESFFPPQTIPVHPHLELGSQPLEGILASGPVAALLRPYARLLGGSTLLRSLAQASTVILPRP